MIPAWSIGVILLGCVIGLPVPFNRTQRNTRACENKTSLQLNTTDNSTEMTSFSKTTFSVWVRGCPFSTCLISNLGSSMQDGDEKAGSASTDPFGIGKK
ncbi:hypothetical protein UPYG_G00344510 [Umbra pygmaea]|uniref:Secreted protein n=1 Tax=Umbra pygmaea TaxID=75934 RepID=A0ABD0VYF8_UMBPY